MKIFFSIIISVFFLTGCASTRVGGDCDPSHGGFFTGISCASSGGYDQRVRSLNQEMVKSELDNEKISRDLKSAQGEAASLELEKRKLSEQYKTLDSEIDDLEKKANKSKRKKEMLLTSLRNLRNQEALIKSNKNANPEEISKKLNDLRKKKEELEAEIDLVRGN